MQQTHLSIARPLPSTPRTSFPWELTPETRRVGKEGLARARAILDAKAQGEGQLTLELDLEPVVTSITNAAPSPLRTPKASERSKLAA